MRILRRLTTPAALAAAALAAAAVPAMAATAAPAATYPVGTLTTVNHAGSTGPQYVVTAYVLNYLSYCYSGGGATYVVNANGIHIRYAPNAI